MSRLLPLFLLTLMLQWSNGLVAQEQPPQLIDQRVHPRNLVGDEITITGYEQKNGAILNTLANDSRESTQAILRYRLNNKELRRELKLLCAAVLSFQGDPVGQRFLLDSASQAKPEDLPNIYHAIYLSWRQSWNPNPAENPRRNIDMKWAEDFMLQALANEKLITGSKKLAVRHYAVHYGHFHTILTQQKCAKVTTPLMKLISDEIQMAPSDELFSTRLGFGEVAHDVLGSLKEWNQPQLQPVMLNIVEYSVTKDIGSWSLFYALEWLIKRHDPTVTPLILAGLYHSEVYSALMGTTHPAYLKAIKEHLPTLNRKLPTKSAQFRQEIELAHATLILMVGENRNPVDALITFVNEPINLQRNYAIYYLKGFDDPRITRWATKQIQQETDWYVPFALIELLGEANTPAANHSLIQLLDYSFDKISPEEGINYTTRHYHEAIVKELEKNTRQQFGPDINQWKKWMQSQS